MSDEVTDIRSKHSSAEPPPDRAQAKKGNERGIWVVAGRCAGSLLAMLTYGLLARFLTRADYGRFTLIMSAIMFFGLVARFGLDKALVRFIAEGFGAGQRQRVHTAMRLGMRTLLLSLAVCCVVAPLLLALLSRFFPAVPGDGMSLTLIVLGVVFTSLLQYIAEVFRGMHDQRNAATFDASASKPLANGLYLAVVAAVGFMLPMNSTGAVALQVAVFGGLSIFGGLTLWKALPRIDHLTPKDDVSIVPLTAGLFLATCVPLLLSQVVAFCSMQGDVWILGATSSDDDVGKFAAARRFVVAISMPLSAFNLMVLPSIPKLYVKGQLAELQKLLQQNATTASIPSLLITAVTLLFPGLLLTLMFGEKYADAALLLVILSVGQTFYMLTGSCGQVLMLTGRERVGFLVELVAAIVMFTVGPLVAMHSGLTAFVVLISAVLTLKNITMWILVKWLVGVWTHATPACVVDLWHKLKGRGKKQKKPAAAVLPPLPVLASETLEVSEVLNG